LTFNGLHGAISQKIEPFTTTATRTSNPKCLYNIVTDLINALPGNSSVNTAQHIIIDEAVFSVSSTPNSGGTMGLCNPFLKNSSVNTPPRKQ
jgi:hypothetical protein